MRENESVDFYMDKKEMIELAPGYMNIVSLDFQLKTLINNCSNEIDRMTPCVDKKYEEFFGNNYKMEVIKDLNRTLTCFDGYKVLHSLTGCLQPCQKINYLANTVLR